MSKCVNTPKPKNTPGVKICQYPQVVYYSPNYFFYEKIESAQYKATLAMTGAIQGASRDKIYQELGLESLTSRRWYKRLVCMFKIINQNASYYMINLIPKYGSTTRTKNNGMPSYKCRTNCFKCSFFPSTLNDWFNLDINIRNSESIRYSSVGCYPSFVRFNIAYTIFSILKG